MPWPKNRTPYAGSGYAWQRLRTQILKRDNYVCRWCGELATTADHVKARAFGGTDTPDNLVACCRMCNARRAHEQSKQGQARAKALRQRAPESHPGTVKAVTRW